MGLMIFMLGAAALAVALAYAGLNACVFLSVIALVQFRIFRKNSAGNSRLQKVWTVLYGVSTAALVLG